MITYVRKWGNSMALRIPRALVEQLNLKPDSALELSVNDGVLYVKPVQAAFPTLEELLAQVPSGTAFEEVDWGKPAGGEVW